MARSPTLLRLVSLLALCVVPLFASGCVGLLGNSSGERPLTEDEIIKLFVAEPDSQGGNGFAFTVAVLDPQGYFDGSMTMSRLPATAKFAALKAFGRAKVVGRFSGGFVSVKSDEITASAVAVISAGGSSLCLQLSGRSKTGYSAQVVTGQFSVLGGTGRAARLRASGPFISVEPQPDYKGTGRVSLRVRAAAKTASLGPARGLTPACRAATKPPSAPRPPATATATLDGYTFAAAGAKALPAGSQVIPDGSTVTGTTGCGQSLYAVLTYSGPATTTDGAFFGPSGTVTIKQPVHTGQNLLFLLNSPPNGSYSMKLGFTGVNAPGFGGSLTLNRSC